MLHLLMHADHTVELAAQHIGIKAIIVDAENEAAERFYREYGFEYLHGKSRTRAGRTLFLELGAGGTTG